MSELKYMDLSLDEILKNIEVCKSVVAGQEESICKFRDIILTASNKRVTSKRKTTIFLAGAGIRFDCKSLCNETDAFGILCICI